MNIPLINKHNPLPKSYEPVLTEVAHGCYLEENAAKAMQKLLCAAKADGIHLKIFSAYRSPAYQHALIEKDVARYIAAGMCENEARRKSAQSIAIPYESEHNAGLAADISCMDWRGEITADFDKTPEFAWLNANAHHFGFILRYPKDAEHITEITYEPWHYRYVGTPHSNYIKRTGITLEEYLCKRKYPNKRKRPQAR